MEWFSKIQKQAQEAADMLISSETAEKARNLAAQATQQATVLAQQATVRAQVKQADISTCAVHCQALLHHSLPLVPQEVAKEAIGEAEKSISALRQKASEDPCTAPLPCTPALRGALCL
jgi:vacuolar-type H+-ATPase subunit H